MEALEAQERILTVRDTTAAEDESSNDSSSENIQDLADFNKIAETSISKNAQETKLQKRTDFSPISDDNISISALTTAYENALTSEEIVYVENNGTTGSSITPNVIIQDIQQFIGGDEDQNHVLSNIPQIYVDEETAEKMREVGFEQVVNPQEGSKEDKQNSILMNQVTMTNILAHLFVVQQNMQVAISKLECSIGTLNAVMSQSSPSDFLCLAEFPIKTEEALEEFNLKLKDSIYANAMVSVLVLQNQILFIYHKLLSTGFSFTIFSWKCLYVSASERKFYYGKAV